VNDDDRRILLKRRALFVSAALAATACGASGPGPTTSPSSVDVAPVGSGNGEPTPAPVRETSVDPAAPPEIVVPAGASDTARNMYAHLKTQVTRLQTEVAAVARNMLTCDPDRCQTDAAIEDLARAFASTRFLLEELSPHCPGSSEHGKAYQEVVEQQQAFFEAKLELHRKGLLEQMRSVGDFPERFRAATLRANAAQPRVCLDCGDW
jgi:hypothetical protein